LSEQEKSIEMSRTIIDLENSDEPKITRGAGGKAPAHLSQFIGSEAEEIDDGICSWCQLINCVCAYDIDAPAEEEDQLEGEQGSEEISPPRSLKRSVADLSGIDEFGENPDLAEYFEQYKLTEQQQIAMCRTYANYLSQKVRSRMRVNVPMGAYKALPGAPRKNNGGYQRHRWGPTRTNRALDLDEEQE